MNKKRKFISVDPSMNNCAIVWGYIDGNNIEPVDWEVSVTKKGTGKINVAVDTINRARKTIEAIQYRLILWEPEVCFGEVPSGSQSSNAMRSYGLSCAFLAMLPNQIFVTPTDVKKFVNGTNSASKDDVMLLAREMFPNFKWETDKKGNLIKARMEHVADALIIACAGLNKI